MFILANFLNKSLWLQQDPSTVKQLWNCLFLDFLTCFRWLCRCFLRSLNSCSPLCWWCNYQIDNSLSAEPVLSLPVNRFKTWRQWLYLFILFCKKKEDILSCITDYTRNTNTTNNDSIARVWLEKNLIKKNDTLFRTC